MCMLNIISLIITHVISRTPRLPGPESLTLKESLKISLPTLPWHYTPLSLIPTLNNDKELLAIFEAFKFWHHYLEGTPILINVITDYKNLQYFSTVKILTQQQACWSEFLSQFYIVIHFHPGKLRTKPDALTRRWDVYPKEGERNYAAVNPHNFRPVFTNEQLASSLQATVLYSLVLRAATIMDLKTLHSNIRSVLHSDPAISKHLSNPTLR